MLVSCVYQLVYPPDMRSVDTNWQFLETWYEHHDIHILVHACKLGTSSEPFFLGCSIFVLSLGVKKQANIYGIT